MVIVKILFKPLFKATLSKSLARMRSSLSPMEYKFFFERLRAIKEELNRILENPMEGIMQSFKTWLWKQPSFPRSVAMSFGMVLLSLIWLWVLVPFFPMPRLKGDTSMWQFMRDFSVTTNSVLLAIGVLTEELMFRLPLVWATRRCGIGWISFWMVLWSGLAFGLLHGLNMFAVCHQGVAGFMLAIVFIKCGAAHGNPWRGLFFSYLYHAIFNLPFMIPLVLAYSKTT